MAKPTEDCRDALIAATLASAVDLLRIQDLNEALPKVLEALGKASGVDRMQLLQFGTRAPGSAAPCVRQHSWCGPGIAPARNLESYVNRKAVIAGFAAWHDMFERGEIVDRTTETFEPGLCEFFAVDGVQSVIAVPILVAGRVWGCIGFDSCRAARHWHAREIETLNLLSEVIGGNVQRARALSRFADAHRIIENGASILFRLAPEREMQLHYISPNVKRYGYTPHQLLASQTHWSQLIDPSDIDHVLASLQSILSGDATEAVVQFRLIKPDGSRVWFESHASAQRDEHSNPTAIEGILTDITEHKKATLEMEKMARTDSLTALANRRVFLEHLAKRNKRKSDDDRLVSVLFIDLDGFKLVNDTHGHPTGDRLLVAVAERLTRSMRKANTVARLGGDEFAVLQSNLSSHEFALSAADKIRRVLSEPYMIDGLTLTVGASIGLDCEIAGMFEDNELLARADLALYQAKGEGRNCVRSYDPSLDGSSAAGAARKAIPRTAA